MTLFKANTSFKSFDQMYKAVSKPEYLESMVSPEEVERIRLSLESAKGVDLVQYSVIKNFMTLQFERHVKDYCDLMHCYPDSYFVYHFYQMSENKWLQRVKYFLLDRVTTNSLVNLPLNLFEQYLTPNSRYPFSWRLLDRQFFAHKFSPEKVLPDNAFGDQLKNQFQIRMISRENNCLSRLLKHPDKITPQIRKAFRRVVIHAHGGGFITMTSASQQNYLIKFANQADCVVFSIDYPLAPLKTYKTIIECVFRAYLFIRVS